MLKNISAYAIFGIVAKSFSLLIIPLIARELSVEVFGNYIVLISIIMLIQSTFLFGFEHSLNYFFNKFKSDKNKQILVSTQIIFILLSATVFSIIASLALSNRMANIDLILTWGLLTLVVAHFTTLLKVDMNVRVFIKSQLLQSATLLCLIYLFVIMLSQSLEGVIYANILSLMTTIIFIFIFIKKYLSLTFNISLLKKVLIYGLPLMPSGAVLWASMQLDRYFILYFMDEYSLGIYAFSLAIVMIPLFLKTAVKSAIDPFIMKSFHTGPNKTKEIISNYFTLSLLVFSFVFLFLSLFSHEIVMLMGGVKYLEAIPYIPWLLLIANLTVCNQYFIYGINFSKRNIFILKGLIYMLFINVLFMFALINSLGVYGVIVANFIANLFYTLYLYKTSKKLYSIDYHAKKNIFIIVSMLIIFTLNFYMFPESYVLKILSLLFYIIINMPTSMHIKRLIT